MLAVTSNSDVMPVSIVNIDEINAIILEHNPFSQPPFVTANNVWGKGFPDVESLNSHASDAVFKALEEVQARKLSAASLLITAQDGTGKSHVISRIRHRLQDLGGALFILANKFSDLNQVKPGFQQLVAESLFNIGSQGVKQWQELATAMANDVLRAKNPNTTPFEPKDLVKRFEDSADDEKNQKQVKVLTKEFCKLKTIQDPAIVQAIFWTLSDEEAAYASNWLGGGELAQYKANDLRLPAQNQSFNTVLQILNIISEYNSLIICFDEMDIADFNDAGLRKAQVIANLVKELVENLKRGVILSVMMPGVWKNEVQLNMPAAVSTKMATYTSPLDLQYLNAAKTVELVSFFLKDYYESRAIIPPHPVYPFNENQLQVIGEGSPTVREILKWCRENCKPLVKETLEKHFSPISEESPVELAFLAEMADDHTSSLDNSFLIAGALLFSFMGLIGETIEGIIISDVTNAFGKRGGKEQYLNFKITGKDRIKPLGIAVSVVQENSGRFIAGALKKLLTPEKFGLTRGCLVRSPDRPISHHIKSVYLESLASQGGEFVKLNLHDIKPLLALKMVREKSESDYKVSREQIQEFIQQYGEKYQLGKFNPLICEILSDPSYQVPQNLVDEPEADELFVLEKQQVIDESEVDDSDILDELIEHD
jgi:hypothetical protein